MSAIDIAFGVLKNYTPNWRDEVRNIAPLERHEVPLIDLDLTDDEEYKTSLPGFLSSGTKVHVFQHPHSQAHVIKVPNDDPYYQEAFHNRVDSDEDDVFAFLESIGYPIVSELPVDLGASTYSIQPKVEPFVHQPHEKSLRRNMAAADRALQHILRDRHIRNYGVDSAGNVRNFDLEQIGESDEPFPYGGGKRAEAFQTNVLDEVGIQHPASRVLDFFNDREEGRFNAFKELMEHIEPYSDNPDTLTLDGKPYWLEGYE
jgi:hypothetical protein